MLQPGDWYDPDANLPYWVLWRIKTVKQLDGLIGRFVQQRLADVLPEKLALDVAKRITAVSARVALKSGGAEKAVTLDQLQGFAAFTEEWPCGTGWPGKWRFPPPPPPWWTRAVEGPTPWPIKQAAGLADAGLVVSTLMDLTGKFASADLARGLNAELETVGKQLAG